MAADSKISDFTSYQYNTGSGDIDLSTLEGVSIDAPVVINGQNRKFNLSQILTVLRQYFGQEVNKLITEALTTNLQDQINTLVVNSLQDNSSLNSAIDSRLSTNQTITSLQNSANEVINVKNRVDYLYNQDNWPTNFITLINGTTPISYALPSGPGMTGVARNQLQIPVSNMQLPNFYIQITIQDVVNNDQTISVTSKVIIQNYDGTNNINLVGGDLQSITLNCIVATTSGARYVSTQTKQISPTITVPEASSQRWTLPAETQTFSELSSQLSNNEVVDNISINCQINNQQFSSIAWKRGNTVQIAEGYITLQNGSQV